MKRYPHFDQSLDPAEVKAPYETFTSDPAGMNETNTINRAELVGIWAAHDSQPSITYSGPRSLL